MKLTKLFLLCAVLTALASCCSADTETDAHNSEKAGDFQQAAAVLNKTIADTNLPAADRKKLEFQLDRLERIRLNFPLTRSALFERLKKSVTGLERAEFEQWLSEKRFDVRTIDGEERFMVSSVANLFWQVVPGSHQWPILCTVPADTTTSFTDVTVALAEGYHAVNVPMKAGDVLFFNGQLVHGSLPNQTANRFRRSLIAHYIAGEAEQVYKWYKPALRFDGSEVDIGTSERGGTCGTWVTRNGTPVLEIVGEEPNDTIIGRH